MTDAPSGQSSGATSSGVLGGGGGGEPGATSERHGSLAADAWRDLKSSPLFWVASSLIALLIIIAAFPGLFTTRDPSFCQLSRSLEPPSSKAWFGYDFQGCDLYSRTLFGARASILVGVLVTLGTAVLGGFIGAMAGYYGGWVDSVLSRLVDIFFAVPLILAGLVFLSVFPNFGIWGVVAALTIFGWTTAARIMRSSVISTKNVDYVTAARALGAGTSRIIVRHVLPNSIAPVVVVAMISLGIFISVEATLSFLGIGLQPPTISWGIQISDGQRYFLRAPHILLIPSGFLMVTVLSFILLGDAVRDALDPKLR
jgi:oligopeptide transport system permease protein